MTISEERRDIRRGIKSAQTKWQRYGDPNKPPAAMRKALAHEPHERVEGGPWVFRLETPVFNPSHGEVIPYTKEILIKPGMSEAATDYVVRHEIGHTRYPATETDCISDAIVEAWEKQSSISELDSDSDFIDTLNRAGALLSELVASYYALTIEPGDELARNSVGSLKFEGGLWFSSDLVDRLDAKAREIVGYRGRSVMVGYD